MEKKTKILSIVIQIALFLAFIGFFFSLFIGNEKNISTYTNLILIFACSNYFFLARQKLEDASTVDSHCGDSFICLDENSYLNYTRRLILQDCEGLQDYYII